MGTIVPITAKELAALTSRGRRPRRSFPQDQSIKAAPGGGRARSFQASTPTPNIAIFGDNFHIYPTTDGFPGWGGQTFFVWKSHGPVSWRAWVRSTNPILTLNGTSGDVPWATGNAWAPAIIALDNKYYFYFSGQNPAHDRKTIGVAIATSPDGPFVAEPEAFILNNESITTGQAIDSCAFQDSQTCRNYLFWATAVRSCTLSLRTICPL
jgi:beta-xylosidase